MCVAAATAVAVQAVRADVLAAAYTRNPERFVGKHPEPAELPAAAWINRPRPAANSLNES